MLLGTGISVMFSVREHRSRKDAELARAKTAGLLTQASARESITRAAILLNQNQVEEADALLRQSPVSEIAPSAEAAYVFRFLGERNAMLGRWKEASECFSRLMMANRFVPAEQVALGNDLLFAAPAMLEAGDVTAYDALRRDILARFQQMDHPVGAEHLVKSCLLTPLPRAMLDDLRPMTAGFRITEWAAKPRTEISAFHEWFALATILFDYRDGRHQGAYEGGSHGLAFAKTPSCRASMLIVRALAGHALGKETTHRDLAEASTLIRKASSRVVVEERADYDLSQGSWYAWAVARILQREAASLVAR